jgi:oxygen-dependent protoporphyrinogen oxidase
VTPEPGAAEKKAENNAVVVIGAGFSGLVSAYYLVQAGFSVEIYEGSGRVGGMIDSVETDFARIETAANGLLASARVEALFDAAGVLPVEAGQYDKTGKKRYIYRQGRARRWPLSVGETLGILVRVPALRWKKPHPGESVESWAKRALGDSASRYLVVPALQGIYAGDASQMSAELVFGKYFDPALRARGAKGQRRGSVAPAAGMRALIHGLRRYLLTAGVKIYYGSRPALASLGRPVVVATSLPAARSLLAEAGNPAARAMASARMVPLVCAHQTYPRASAHLDGFGCLFPRGEGIRALGVLFEDSIYGQRSGDHLERWILGGATDPGIASLSDEEVFEVVRQDRLRLVGSEVPPVGRTLTRWPSAIPHYDLGLREALYSPEVTRLPKDGIFLVGNYLGKLGLSGILEEAEKIPARIRKERSA